MISVAIIFDNFGPYHMARLRAVAKTCALTAIEVAGKSAVYAWDRTQDGEDFRRKTLLEQGTSGEVSARALRARIEQMFAGNKPDVVLVPGWASATAWATMDVCVKRRIPMVCMSESTAWDEPRRFWKEWIKARLVRLFSSALVGGERHRDYLVKLGFPRDRVFLGYDAVDNAYFAGRAKAAREAADKIREHHGLPPRYFLASARFVEKKNLSRLLTAYALYRLSCARPWPLVLLGEGELRPALEDQLRLLAIESAVSMPGFRQYDLLPDYYALADAFIHPSTIEPWGLVVNEAMSCGLPVLVSERCGCVPELVHDGENGFIFDPMDEDEMADRMKRVSAPGFPRATLGAAGEKIVAQWGPDRFAQGCLDAVKEAITRGPAQPGKFEGTLLELGCRR